MRILFDGRLSVDYGFAFLKPASSDAEGRLLECRGGQQNGLCGAAEEGVLSLMFGSTMGDLPFRVELWPAAPPLDSEWEDVVEVSFVTDDVEPLVLSTFNGGHTIAGLDGRYRVRYNVSGLDEAPDRFVSAGEEPLDRTLLQLWPDETWRPDEIIRQTSDIAAYWHRVARDTPAPPARPSPAERAIARAAAEAEQQAATREAMDRWMDEINWAGGAPSDRLRAIGGLNAQLFRRDADLAETLAALPPEVQRPLSVWCAERAAERTGRQRHPLVAAALRALRAGAALPPGMADWHAAWQTLNPGPPSVNVATIAVVDPDDPPAEPDLDPDAVLVWVLEEAAGPDPARAAFGAVEAVLTGRHPCAEPDEIRAAIARLT